MESPAKRPPRSWSLDVLRGGCALTVFLNHWVLWSNFQPAGVFESGLHRWLGHAYELFVAIAWPTGAQHPTVVCFFMLSGYCIHVAFERQIGPATPAIAWGAYFARRAWRILPVYWGASLLGLLFVAAEVWHPTGDPLLRLHAAATPAGVAARLGGYTGVWPHEVFAGNYILGTVAVEMIFYVVYPLFFRAAAAGRWLALGVGAVSLQFLALLLQPFINPFVLFPGVLIMALFWYSGALAAHLRLKRQWRVKGWWLGAAYALFLGLKLTPYFYGLNLAKQVAWGGFCMLLLCWLLDWETRQDGWREFAPIRFLRRTGVVSYSLYAVHTPVILLVNWAMLTWLGSRNYGLQLGLNLVLAFAATLAFHHLVEERFYHIRSPG